MDWKEAHGKAVAWLQRVANSIEPDNTFRSQVLTELIQQQVTSISTISQVNCNFYRFDGTISDGFSLLREVNERCFYISYFCHCSDEAVKEYHVSDWEHLIFVLALDELELCNLEPLQNRLALLRDDISAMGTMLNLPETALDAKLEQFKGRLREGKPPRIKKGLSGPLQALDYLRGKQYSSVLERCYYEYTKLCAFTHQSPRKLTFRRSHSKAKNQDIQESAPIRSQLDRLAADVMVYVALSCKLATEYSKDKVDVHVAAEECWNYFAGASLFGLALDALGINSNRLGVITLNGIN